MSNITTYDPDFWGGMEQQDFAIPLVSIGQDKTQKGKPGFFNYNHGKSVDKIAGCKLLKPLKTRVLYGKTFKDASLCGSDDFYVPAARYESPIAASCLNCPAAQWGDDIPAKAELAKKLWGKSIDRKPMCAETYNMLMLDGEGLPFYIKFQKTHIKIVQEKLLSRLRFGFPKTPPFLVAFDMLIKNQDGGQGSYYIPIFDNFRVVESGEEMEQVNQAYQTFASNAHVHLAKQHEQMDSEKHDEVPF